MRTPAFWYKKHGMLSDVLMPLAVLYYCALRLRERFFPVTPTKVEARVICVGNLTAGGAGKTPVARYIARHLLAQGHKVAFLSRGYKGDATQVTRVNVHSHTAQQVGDEPLLLARVAPCYVAQNRAAAAQQAVKDGFTHLVMDDGHQHPYLHKDVSIVVIDGLHGIGNGLLMPAGPLRDRFQNGVKHANAVLFMGEDKHQLSRKVPTHCKTLYATPVLLGIPSPAPEQVVAFTGLGLPEKFFSLLRARGLQLAASVPFADHHYYTAHDIAFLREQAQQHNAPLVTTTKDAVKWPADAQKDLIVLDLDVQMQNPDILAGLL